MQNQVEAELGRECKRKFCSGDAAGTNVGIAAMPLVTMMV
jgi:hypothetical protein